MKIQITIVIPDDGAEDTLDRIYEQAFLSGVELTAKKTTARVITELCHDALNLPIPPTRGQSALTPEQRRERGKAARARRRSKATKFSL